jgi:hypothetical protein
MEDPQAAFAPVLRALALDALGRIAAEPWLHVKRLLAEHAEEDALAAARWPAAPNGEAVTPPLPRLETIADRAALQLALAGELRSTAATADPGTVALLVPLAIAQERHADELPGRRATTLHPAADGTALREPLADPAAEADVLAAEAAARTAAERPEELAEHAQAAAEHLRRV